MEKWASLSLKWKVLILFLITFLVVLNLGFFYSYSLNAAKKDAEVIDALGRQRMLSQAMVFGMLSAGVEGKQGSALRRVRAWPGRLML